MGRNFIVCWIISGWQNVQFTSSFFLSGTVVFSLCVSFPYNVPGNWSHVVHHAVLKPVYSNSEAQNTELPSTFLDFMPRESGRHAQDSRWRRFNAGCPTCCNISWSRCTYLKITRLSAFVRLQMTFLVPWSQPNARFGCTNEGASSALCLAHLRPHVHRAGDLQPSSDVIQ